MSWFGQKHHGHADRGLNLHASALQFNGPPRLAINAADLFTYAQVSEHAGRIARRNLEGHALAGPAAIEPKQQPRMHSAAAIMARQNAKAPVPTVKPGSVPFGIDKIRPPHQRAVRKDP